MFRVVVSVLFLLATQAFALDLSKMNETERSLLQDEIRLYLLENPEIKVPLPKKISIDVPNNHLKYAITWYSIAISILLYYLYFRKKK